MSKMVKKLSWLTPIALLVSLPASAVSMSITQTSPNPGFTIDDYFVEVEDGFATEFEVLETWTSTADRNVRKLITIDYDSGFPAADPFEFEFKVTNDTPNDWPGYNFTFSGLGPLQLGDVLVAWENELEDIDDNPAFFSSAIVGNNLRFYNGAHPSDSMVAYELYFDLNALQQADITELGVVQTAVPLPAAAWLMFGGLGMLVGFARKRKIT